MLKFPANIFGSRGNSNLPKWSSGPLFFGIWLK